MAKTESKNLASKQLASYELTAAFCRLQVDDYMQRVQESLLRDAFGVSARDPRRGSLLPADTTFESQFGRKIDTDRAERNAVIEGYTSSGAAHVPAPKANQEWR